MAVPAGDAAARDALADEREAMPTAIDSVAADDAADDDGDGRGARIPGATTTADARVDDERERAVRRRVRVVVLAQ